MATREQRHRAGHYEILVETLAKFEFFEAGWNPYQRYLDVDKVDFILRRRDGVQLKYREVQVKYGKLYDCTRPWEKPLFDVTSWRFFNEGEFARFLARRDFFIAYVLAHDSGYKGDIFIFPVKQFHDLLIKAVVAGGRRRVYLSRSVADQSRWYFRIASRFDAISKDTCVDISQYRRNFAVLQ